MRIVWIKLFLVTLFVHSDMIRKYEIISASGPPVRRDSSDGLFSPPRSSI